MADELEEEDMVDATFVHATVCAPGQDAHLPIFTASHIEADVLLDATDFAAAPAEEPRKKKSRGPQQKADLGWETDLDTEDEDKFEAKRSEMQIAEAGKIAWLGRKKPRDCGRDKKEAVALCPYLREPRVLCDAKHRYLFFHNGRFKIQVIAVLAHALCKLLRSTRRAATEITS
jgi:hypothetical protein